MDQKINYKEAIQRLREASQPPCDCCEDPGACLSEPEPDADSPRVDRIDLFDIIALLDIVKQKLKMSKDLAHKALKDYDDFESNGIDQEEAAILAQTVLGLYELMDKGVLPDTWA